MLSVYLMGPKMARERPGELEVCAKEDSLSFLTGLEQYHRHLRNNATREHSRPSRVATISSVCFPAGVLALALGPQSLFSVSAHRRTAPSCDNSEARNLVCTRVCSKFLPRQVGKNQVAHASCSSPSKHKSVATLLPVMSHLRLCHSPCRCLTENAIPRSLGLLIADPLAFKRVRAERRSKPRPHNKQSTTAM
jgi:hypothetical protein